MLAKEPLFDYTIKAVKQKGAPQYMNRDDSRQPQWHQHGRRREKNYKRQQWDKQRNSGWIEKKRKE